MLQALPQPDMIVPCHLRTLGLLGLRAPKLDLPVRLDGPLALLDSARPGNSSPVQIIPIAPPAGVANNAPGDLPGASVLAVRRDLELRTGLVGLVGLLGGQGDALWYHATLVFNPRFLSLPNYRMERSYLVVRAGLQADGLLVHETVILAGVEVGKVERVAREDGQLAVLALDDVGVLLACKICRQYLAFELSNSPLDV